jgi:hypothetical protein
MPFAMNKGLGMKPPCFSILSHQSPASSRASPARSPQINRTLAGQRALRYLSSTVRRQWRRRWLPAAAPAPANSRTSTEPDRRPRTTPTQQRLRPPPLRRARDAAQAQGTGRQPRAERAGARPLPAQQSGRAWMLLSWRHDRPHPSRASRDGLPIRTGIANSLHSSVAPTEPDVKRIGERGYSAFGDPPGRS